MTELCTQKSSVRRWIEQEMAEDVDSPIMTESRPPKSAARRWAEQEMAEAEAEDVDSPIMTQSRPQKSVARRRAEQETDGDVASQFVGYFYTALKTGDDVVLAVRVSGSGQKTHMPDQESSLRTPCEQKGVIVVEVVPYIGSASGKKGDNWSSWIRKVYDTARARNAKVLAFSIDRFIRNPYYNSQDPIRCKLRATEKDLQELREQTLGVELVTLMHPDASFEEVHRRKVMIGQASTKKPLGRPKKQLREVLNPIVIKLESQGKTYTEITEAIGVTRGTAHRWVQRSKK